MSSSKLVNGGERMRLGTIGRCADGLKGEGVFGSVGWDIFGLFDKVDHCGFWKQKDREVDERQGANPGP